MGKAKVVTERIVYDLLYKQAKVKCKIALGCLELWCDTGDVSYYDDAVTAKSHYDAIVESAGILGHNIVDGGTTMPSFEKFKSKHNRAVETGQYRPRYGLVQAR